MTDIVFIHGLWVSHTSWQPWIERFATEGHRSIAPGWPGEAETVTATRENLDAQAGFSLRQVTDHFAAIIDQFDTRPSRSGTRSVV